VRHRIASYSQESQRYVNLSDPEFVVPPGVAQSPEAMRIWEDLTGRMKGAYRDLRELGIKKEDARFLLPNATATRIVVTMNCRELRHFFRVRCDRAAQWEIRALAKEMLKLAYRVAPVVFQDLCTEFIE
jgi:thymidylate synthase (FAD)